MAAREAYSLYGERAVEGANEADGPFSSLWGRVEAVGAERGQIEIGRAPDDEIGDHAGAVRPEREAGWAVARGDIRSGNARDAAEDGEAVGGERAEADPGLEHV